MSTYGEVYAATLRCLTGKAGGPYSVASHAKEAHLQAREALRIEREEMAQGPGRVDALECELRTKIEHQQITIDRQAELLWQLEKAAKVTEEANWKPCPDGHELTYDERHPYTYLCVKCGVSITDDELERVGFDNRASFTGREIS